MSYSFRQLRNAILAGDARPAGFAYGGPLASERLAALRAAPHLQEFLSELRAEAERARTTPIPDLPFSLFRIFETIGTRREFEQPYFERRGRLVALAFASLLDETDTYIDAVQDTLWAICNEYTWCLPAHIGPGAGPGRSGRLQPEQVVDLFAAETAHALAETLTMLEGRLDPWIEYRIRSEIERRIFRPLFHDPVHFFWESVPMNWASVCAGAAGMAALLLERDPERLAGMVDRCVSAMECFLEGYGDDGGCPEGIGYWQYGFGYYVYFVEMLYEYTNKRIDLLQGEKIKRIASYPAGVNLGGASFVNYSDGSSHNTLRTGLVSRLAARTGCAVPELERVPNSHIDRNHRWPHVTGDLLWTNPELIGKPTPVGSVLFPDLGWVVDRRRIGDTAVGFSARAGNNAEPHNQNDLGHFILHVGGESLLVDLGAGLYTRQYFGPQRYEHIHNRSLGHSVPLIDGHEQLPGAEYAAAVRSYEALPNGVLFEVDLKNAYAVASLSRFVRTFRWSQPKPDAPVELALTDAFGFESAPSALEEIFVSLHKPTLEAGQVVWQGKHGRVTLTYDAGQFSPATEEIPSRNHNDEPIVVHRLRLSATQPQAQAEYTFRFVVSAE